MMTRPIHPSTPPSIPQVEGQKEGGRHRETMVAYLVISSLMVYHPLLLTELLNSPGESDWPSEKLRLYEFIVRSFLACCSLDAVGYETTVEVAVGGR